MIVSNSDVLPELLDESAKIFFWPASNHTLMKLTALFQTHHILAPFQLGQSFLAIHQWKDQLPEVLNEISTIMSPKECMDTRVLIHDEPPFSPDDFSRVMSLNQFIGFATSQWLLSLLKEDRFFTVYQGIYDLQDPNLSLWGVESLLRGISESGEILSGEKLFSTAKAGNLKSPLDLKGRHKALQGFGRCAARHLHLFINLSSHALDDFNISIRSTAKIVDSLGLNPRQVCFEIVKPEKDGNIPLLQEVVDTLRNFGFKIALDHLGTGFNDSQYISLLNPDIIKIERSIIHKIHQDPLKSSFLSQLIHACTPCGGKIVAQGIESMGELHWCREQGIHYGQGFLLSKPQPMDAFAGLQTKPLSAPAPLYPFSP